MVANVDNHELRIQTLENQTTPNITIEGYWKYLRSSDRKNIVCGIAQDQHLDTLTMEELGYTCDVRYRQTSRGESATCRCKRL